MVLQVLLQGGDALRHGTVVHVRGLQELAERVLVVVHVLARLGHLELEVVRRGLDALMVPLQDALEQLVVVGDLHAHGVEGGRGLAAQHLNALVGDAGLIVELLEVVLHEVQRVGVRHDDPVELVQQLRVPAVIVLEPPY